MFKRLVHLQDGKVIRIPSEFKPTPWIGIFGALAIGAMSLFTYYNGALDVTVVTIVCLGPILGLLVWGIPRHWTCFDLRTRQMSKTILGMSEESVHFDEIKSLKIETETITPVVFANGVYSGGNAKYDWYHVVCETATPIRIFKSDSYEEALAIGQLIHRSTNIHAQFDTSLSTIARARSQKLISILGILAAAVLIFLIRRFFHLE